MSHVNSIDQLQQSWEEKRYDPHAILGLHPRDKEQKVIRLWRPGADKIYVELFSQVQEATKIGDLGLFELKVPPHTSLKDYRIYHQNGLLAHDPYAFSPTFGDMDSHLFGKGVHYELYNVLGAKVCEHQGVLGTKFSLWAPSAKSVAVVGEFNHWDGRLNPMRTMGSSGVWELFIPGIGAGEKYKFEVKTAQDHLRIKSDPMAFYTEVRPHNASIVFNIDTYQWSDAAWIEKRVRSTINQPMNIYEVHLGSWRKNKEEFLSYKELAHALAAYCKEMSYTHVELLPVAEHPLDESWGYQITGFYAPTSRFGTPFDFQYFVDHMHKEGIGVILDWVVAHFPTDDFSLAQFDGTYLYEHEDPRKGYHPHWNTYIFNYGRSEVSNFLIANALFWFDKMHVDGLRVDAVASMLYLDYGRNRDEWIPNKYGGKENLEAIEFLKHLNSIVHERFPKVLMIAEESTSFPGVTHPLEWGGLGFDMKWNMGWMNDTLKYFHVDPFFRHHHHNELTFGLLYAFSERFMLVLSHDEVVHGKASLLSKMPGDDWQKFANLRLLYSYAICQPGKKLFFMGTEVGQRNEWYCKEEVHWNLLSEPLHEKYNLMNKELNRLYLRNSAFWENDFDAKGFEWVDFSDRKNSVISYLRKASSSYVLCVHNFTPTYFEEYFVPLRNVHQIQEVFNTDREEFGGSGKINSSVSIHKDPQGKPMGVSIHLSPLATLIFEVTFVL